MNTIWPLPRVTFRELTTIAETRPAALLTSKTAWSKVGSLLNLPVAIQAEPPFVTRAYLEKLARGLPKSVEVVYGIGGGRVMDAAKFVGWWNEKPVVLIPTAIPGDVMFTWVVRTRGEEGGIVDVETGAASEIVIDWDVLRDAPPHLRSGGLVDVLSIVTGLLDWRYAAERSKNIPAQRFVPWAAGIAAAIAQQAFRIADGLGRGEVEDMRLLLDFLGLQAQLCNHLGHSRPEEGSEHFFAYAVEEQMPRGTPHSDMVGPGILFTAALHQQETGPLRNALEAAGIRLNRLNPQIVSRVVRQLPEYAANHNLPYSIVHDMDPLAETTRTALTVAGLA